MSDRAIANPAPDRRPTNPDRPVLVVSPADAPTPTDPPGLTAVVTPGRLLRALKRVWPVAVPLGLVLGVGAAVAVWALRPEKSTAYALLRVAQNQERILQENSRSDPNSSYTRTQLIEMRSRRVLREALKSEKVRQSPILQKQANPLDWLEKELRADLIEGTEIVRVSLTSRGDTADLAPIVNAVVQAYLDVAVKADHQSQLDHLHALDTVVREFEERVRKSQEQIKGLTQALNGGDAQVLSSKQRAMLEEYTALKRDLIQLNGSRRKLEVQVASLRTRLRIGSDLTSGALGGGWVSQLVVTASTVNDPLVERDVDADPRVQALETAVAQQRDQLAQLDGVVAANARTSYRQILQDKIKKTEIDLAIARENRRAVVARRHQMAGTQALVNQLRETETESAMVLQQRDALQVEADEMKRVLDRMGLNSSDLELRRGELERSQSLLKSVSDQREKMDVELKAALRQRVSLWASAEEATVLNPNARLQETAVAGVGGLLLGLLAAGVWDQRRGRIHSSDDVTVGLRLPVVGSLPALRGGRPSARLLAAPAGEADGVALAESADGIRTLLLHDHPGERGVVLMVASPSPGEGKSTLAACLAASLARSGRRTLLVDGDLRRPVLHTLFDLPVGPGLCEVLTGRATAEVAVTPTAIPHLDLLPAGAFDPAAVAGLARPAVRALFARLRERYDYVFVDSSPLLCVPDGFMVARCVDGLLFSVRPGHSQAADVYAGYERVRDHRLPFAGVVVNGLTAPKRYYRGYDRLSPPATADDALPLTAAPKA